ncbi:hypothetical protein ACFYVL_17195 [Streptomyces sp. NPDC004111]|uniref:hypothetical protein n=1 Tax=Streptomyces sp. NPDC004111 TaxID=3364690 RepID=UPI003684ECEA
MTHQHRTGKPGGTPPFIAAGPARLIEADLTDALARGFGCTVSHRAGRVTLVADLRHCRIRTQRLATGRWALISIATSPTPWAPESLTLVLRPVVSSLASLLLDVHVRLTTAMADEDTLIRYGSDAGRRPGSDDDFEVIVFGTLHG